MRYVAHMLVAVCIGIGGYVHYRIWHTEYRHAPVRELFVANWVASALVVVALALVIIWPRLDRWAFVGALLVSVGSLAAFALSRGPGVPTLHGNFKETGLETTASYVFHLGSAKTILVTESLAALLSGGLLFSKPRT
jgi:hypothetical protein